MRTQIQTNRFILRPITLADAEGLFAYAKDPDTGPRAGFPPHKTIEDSISIIKYWLSPESNEQQFVITIKETGEIVGTTGITHLNKHLKTDKNYYAYNLVQEGKTVWEIGLTIAKVHWGKGFATEVIGGVINYLFEEKNADVVMATHSDLNIGSAKAQAKNNLKVVGEYNCGHTWYNTNSAIHTIRVKTRQEWLSEKELAK